MAWVNIRVSMPSWEIMGRMRDSCSGRGRASSSETGGMLVGVLSIVC